MGRSLTLNYDTSNRVKSIADPIGRTVLYSYNAAGYLATVTDPNGGVTAYAYDGQNNLISVKDPGGVITEQNRRTTRTDAWFSRSKPMAESIASRTLS